ncbi:hypothetical protein RPALISO_137 [Ruegeria phage RpAliso]|nr:hypothetical protein RPALISO_137 [Ruegeria phage RpAliso]
MDFVPEFRHFVRLGVTLAITVFVILTAPALISASSTFAVWIGTLDIVIGIILAAVTFATPALDSTSKKIERAFTKKEKQ